MSSPAIVPDQDLDVVQHPTLGTLKFPKDMPPDERNLSIVRAMAMRSSTQPQSTSEPEGFFHSLGAVFNLTPEDYQAAKQKTANMSPLQEALTAVKPPNPKDILTSIAASAKSSFQKGSQEGVDASEALKQGDIKGFLAHIIGQGGYAGATLASPVGGGSMAKAGEQFGQGNIAGGAGTTTGVLAPTLLPEVPGAMRATGRGLEAAAPYVGKGAREAARFGGVGEFIHTGNPLALAGPVIAPAAEKLTTAGMSGLGRLLQKAGKALSPEQEAIVANAESQANAVPAGTPAEATQPASQPSTLPRVNSGEGVLNQALTSLDNKSLLKVAKSRGIDVSAEQQLKPGAANGPIIKKIIADFSPDELDEARNTGLEISRNPPLAGMNVPPELAANAWHYKVLNTFFPDVAIPKTMAQRALSTISQRPTAVMTEGSDLLKALQQMAKSKAAGND